MRHLIVFTLWLCVAASAAAQTPEFSYRFELVRQPALEVRVHAQIPGAPGDTTTLEVDKEWGGVRAGGEDISGITVTDASGAALPFTRPEPYRVVVVHKPGAALHVSYAFAANEHQLQTDPTESRRPIVNPHLFHTVGHLALLFPTYMDDEAPCTVHLSWDGFDEAGWRVVSSWGAGTGDRTLKLSLFDLGDALYVAGDMRLMTRDVHGYPVTITVADADWAFTPEAFADMCGRVVSAERSFFGDYARDFYWISLIATGPADQKGRNIGGTGLNNCFSLTISPNTPLEPGDGSPGALVGVIAHEMFHDWNGILIKRKDPEELAYWFSEGFTDFYARRLRYRAGLIDAQQFAVSLNESLTQYFTNPWIDEPNARIKEDFWNDRDVQRLPYYRGDIVAMILDDAIRRKSNGAQSLDDVMRLIAANARAGAVVDTDALFSVFSIFADQATLVTLRNLVENGGAPKLDGVFAPCLTMEAVEAAAYDLGFDLDASIRSRTINGVRDGSPAARAGVRDGMTLKSWSVQRGDATQPVRLTVQDSAGTRDISYLPQGASVPSYRAAVTGTARDCSSL